MGRCLGRLRGPNLTQMAASSTVCALASFHRTDFWGGGNGEGKLNFSIPGRRELHVNELFLLKKTWLSSSLPPFSGANPVQVGVCVCVGGRWLHGGSCS